MIFLSVIIPTSNRAKYLSGALESLTKQTYKADLFEVIVVDNGSTDNTKEIYQSYTNRINNLRYYYDARPGLHVGRNLGLRVAMSDILVYADDDIEPFPTWLEGIAEAFQDKGVVLVGGKNLPKFGVEPPGWILEMWKKDQKGDKILGYLSILDLGDEIKDITPYHVFGCNFSIRKNVLLEAGGFHPDAMPQELIRYRGDGETHVSRYIFKKEYKVLYQPKASVYHLMPSSRMTEEYFCRRAYNQGISNSYTQIRKQHLEKRSVKLKSMNIKYYWRVVVQMVHKSNLVLIGKLRNKFSLNTCNQNLDIKKSIRNAYQLGWEYHQAEVKRDLSLLDYVLRINYIEE